MMTNARKLAVLLAGALLAAGCGSNTDCTVTPPLERAPASCSAQPGTTLNVAVNWCTCGATEIACDVRDEGGGVIQLEPVITACDASCPSVSTDCPARSVTCQVSVPSTDVPDHLYIFGAQNPEGFVDVPLSVGSNGCSS